MTATLRLAAPLHGGRRVNRGVDQRADVNRSGATPVPAFWLNETRGNLGMNSGDGLRSFADVRKRLVREHSSS
jgi:hypothetical protein